MKYSITLAATLGALLSASPLAAQHEHVGQQSGAKQDSMSAVMGQPTFKQTTDGLNIRVWLITQEEHKKVMKEHMGGQQGKGGMKGMNHGARHDKGMMGGMHGKPKANNNTHHMMGEGMNHDANEMNMEAMTAGTHHVMVVLEDETEAGHEDAVVDIHIVSPTGRDSTVALTRKMNHFGGGLTLDEVGTYGISVAIRDGDRDVPVSFDYKVRSTDR